MASILCIFLVLVIHCKAASSARTLNWFFDTYPIPTFDDEWLDAVVDVGQQQPISPQGVVVEETVGIDPISMEPISPKAGPSDDFPPGDDSYTDIHEYFVTAVSDELQNGTGIRDSSETGGRYGGYDYEWNKVTDATEYAYDRPVDRNITDTSPVMSTTGAAREGEGGAGDGLGAPMPVDPSDVDSYTVIHEYFVAAISKLQQQNGTGSSNSSEDGSSRYGGYDYEWNNITDATESAYASPENK